MLLIGAALVSVGVALWVADLRSLGIDWQPPIWVPLGIGATALIFWVGNGYVMLKLPGRPLGEGERARARARDAAARLDDLERRLGDERLAEAELWDWFPYADAVSLEHLRRNRPALLRAITEAREAIAELAPGG